MGQTTDQITREIHRTRHDLQANLEELETRVKAVADWRDQFRKHTGPMVVAAMLGGVVLSAIVGKR
jgi:hypothetical protein